MAENRTGHLGFPSARVFGTPRKGPRSSSCAWAPKSLLAWGSFTRFSHGEPEKIRPTCRDSLTSVVELSPFLVQWVLPEIGRKTKDGAFPSFGGGDFSTGLPMLLGPMEVFL